MNPSFLEHLIGLEGCPSPYKKVGANTSKKNLLRIIGKVEEGGEGEGDSITDCVLVCKNKIVFALSLYLYQSKLLPQY